MPDGVVNKPSGFLPGGNALAEGRRGFALAAPDAELEPEFRRLLYGIEALRTEARCVVLQFLGVVGGEGVSAVASGFAIAAAREAQSPVLYVRCAPHLPAARTDGAACLRGRVVQTPAPNLRWMDLSLDAVSFAGPDAAGLREEIAATRAHYSAMVLDATGGASPANLGLSRFCDGSVLVVAAGRTRIAAVREARRAVERAGGQVVGVVLTRVRPAMPRFLARFL